MISWLFFLTVSHKKKTFWQSATLGQQWHTVLGVWAIKDNYIFKSLSLWEKVCKVTLPCLLVASAPQIDLQAFIKAASGCAGQGLLDGQLRACVRAWVCLCGPLWLYATVCMCVCVSLRLGHRLLPEVEFHSLLFHYSYKATARLHRVQSCKNFFFFFLRSSQPSSTPPPPLLSLSWLQLEWEWASVEMYFSPFWDFREKPSSTYPISNNFEYEPVLLQLETTTKWQLGGSSCFCFFVFFQTTSQLWSFHHVQSCLTFHKFAHCHVYHISWIEPISSFLYV